MSSPMVLAVIGSYCAMVLSNFLAMKKFFGGKDNKQISDEHPTFVSPDGKTFAIWGFIYLFETVTVVAQAVPSERTDELFGQRCPLTGLDVRERLTLAFLANAVWLPIFNNERFCSELLFLSVGASNAVMEASVALHLGKILDQAVSLHAQAPPVLRYGGDFKIVFVVTGRPSRGVHASGAGAEMKVLPYEPQAAVEDFTAHELPLFIFSCCPPDVKGWTATLEATAGKRLQEIFLVRPPPPPGEPQDCEPVSARMRTTELFPKTLSSMDYLTSGFPEEVGLHHSHVYVYTPWEVPQPHLADVLTHRLGPFSRRCNASPQLEGLERLRRLGFSFMTCPLDLSAPLPEEAVAGLIKKLLSSSLPGQEIERFRRQLRAALPFAGGHCRRSLELINLTLAASSEVGLRAGEPPGTRWACGGRGPRRWTPLHSRRLVAAQRESSATPGD